MTVKLSTHQTALPLIGTQQKKSQKQKKQAPVRIYAKFIPEDNATCESNNTRTTITPHPI